MTETSKFGVSCPSTGKLIKSYDFMPLKEADERVERLSSSWNLWKTSTLKTRADSIAGLGCILLNRKKELALHISTEMGKPLTQAVQEIEKCADLCVHYSEYDDFQPKANINFDKKNEARVTYEPLGVVFGVMPWNFPFWQVFRFAIPNILLGNAVAVKHSPNTTGCALAIESCFREAGIADNFANLVIDVNMVHRLIADRRIRGVSFTGSSTTGIAIAVSAANHLKPSVLELGGSDAYIVCGDADVESAVRDLSVARLLNCGQSCISPKRILVHQSLCEEFVLKTAAAFERYAPADPLSDGAMLGPLARIDLLEKLKRQVNTAIQQGAKCVQGGVAVEGDGYYYSPTVLSDVDEGNIAFKEELFGPVAAITSFLDENEAMRLANSSDFGLGGGVYSQDLDKAWKLASQMECGLCAVNDFVRSDVRFPFGGVKESGWGRELSLEGIRAFANIKTYCSKQL
jgi:succinate-semialdehyde dehydrogenase / glutarate-semialdehyde dehydrogenase